MRALFVPDCRCSRWSTVGRPRGMPCPGCLGQHLDRHISPWRVLCLHELFTSGMSIGRLSSYYRAARFISWRMKMASIEGAACSRELQFNKVLGLRASIHRGASITSFNLRASLPVQVQNTGSNNKPTCQPLIRRSVLGQAGVGEQLPGWHNAVCQYSNACICVVDVCLGELGWCGGRCVGKGGEGLRPVIALALERTSSSVLRQLLWYQTKNEAATASTKDRPGAGRVEKTTASCYQFVREQCVK